MLTKLQLMGLYSKTMLASDVEVGESQEQLRPEMLAMLISVKIGDDFYMKRKYVLLMNQNLCDHSII